MTWAANLPEGIFRDGVVLLGDRGGLYFDVWGDTIILTTEEERFVVDLKTSLPSGNAWGAAWERQARSFVEAVRTRKAPEASGKDGRAVQAVLDALYRSSAAGREVEV
jgi:predicted dehydrogenase